MRAIVRIGFLLGCGLTTSVSAQEAVKFDARRLFSCAEVKPPQNADAARKVVVIVLPVSANFHVEESTVESLHCEFRFPNSVTILDHYPKTQTGTDVAGLTEQQRREHQITDLNVKFGGEGKVGFSVWGVGVSLGGAAERRKRDFNEVETNVKSAHLPPRGQVVVAGTEDEGQTLYFDLKWFNQITRAGLTDYAFLAEVPKDWSGDVVTLNCTARQNGAVAGRLKKLVGLYLSGKSGAREDVEKKLATEKPAAASEGRELVTNSIGTKLKLIPAGSFLRGATPNEGGSDAEKPQRKVTITRPFYLGVYELHFPQFSLTANGEFPGVLKGRRDSPRPPTPPEMGIIGEHPSFSRYFREWAVRKLRKVQYEVTQYEYRQVMNDNPSQFKDSELLPVETVTWFDAVGFCNKLSERERRKPYYKIEGDAVTILGGNGYRLPTEAEWEYACRAPQSPETAAKYPFGDNDADLSTYAWFEKNSDNKTHPVGQKKPNRWGLYDMQGNAWERCQDWYSDKYYTFAPENDPPGPATASTRVMRGGGWSSPAKNCRPAIRSGTEPGNRFDVLGFRLAADQQ